MIIKADNFEEFSSLDGKAQRTFLQEAYESMDNVEQEKFINDNITDASDSAVKDEYDDRDLGDDYVEDDDYDWSGERYKDDHGQLGAETQFSDIQDILYGFLHCRRGKDLYLTLDEATKALADLYRFVGKD